MAGTGNKGTLYWAETANKIDPKITKIKSLRIGSKDLFLLVLKTKELYSKDDINKIAFTDKETKNELTQKSFIEKFLSSVKQKMYGNR